MGKICSFTASDISAFCFELILQVSVMKSANNYSRQTFNALVNSHVLGEHS
jgi:hypothetical protein